MKRFLLPDYLILSFAWNVADVLRLCENVYSVKLPCCSNITIMSAALNPLYSFPFFFLSLRVSGIQIKMSQILFARHAEKESDSVGE